jgi:hypothetical protein
LLTFLARENPLLILDQCYNIYFSQAEFFRFFPPFNLPLCGVFLLLFSKPQNPKVGIRNFSPHLHNSAILRTTKTIAELRTKKSCGIAIADLQNMTSAIPQLSAISGRFSHFLVPFPQLRLFFKIYF